MKTATILRFSELSMLCKFIQVIHASAYRIDTTKLTVKSSFTAFEIAIAIEQFNATLLEQTEKV
jgi:hypothetical protein